MEVDSMGSRQVNAYVLQPRDQTDECRVHCRTCKHWGDRDHTVVDARTEDTPAAVPPPRVVTPLRDCARFEQMPERTFAAWVQRVKGWATPEFIAKDKRCVEADMADAVAGNAPRLSSGCCEGYLATPPNHFCACWERKQ